MIILVVKNSGAMCIPSITGSYGSQAGKNTGKFYFFKIHYRLNLKLFALFNRVTAV